MWRRHCSLIIHDLETYFQVFIIAFISCKLALRPTCWGCIPARIWAASWSSTICCDAWKSRSPPQRVKKSHLNLIKGTIHGCLQSSYLFLTWRNDTCWWDIMSGRRFHNLIAWALEVSTSFSTSACKTENNINTFQYFSSKYIQMFLRMFEKCFEKVIKNIYNEYCYYRLYIALCNIFCKIHVIWIIPASRTCI